MAKGERRFDNEHEIIRDMYVKDKFGVHTIAEELERTPAFVQKILKEQGIGVEPIRQSLFDDFSEENKADIAKRYARGEYVKDICKWYNISLRAFYALLEKMEIPKRGRVGGVK